MIFSNLTILQNLIFIIACVSVLLLLSYLITTIVDRRKNNSEHTDDIDSERETYDSFWGFLFNAFKIKGSLLFLTFASCIAFVVGIYIPGWVGVLIGVVVGAGLTTLIAYLEREPLSEIGEIGEVSVSIPAKGEGMGKVILENDMEVDAESLSKAIKKGKKVIVKEREATKVYVEKK